MGKKFSKVVYLGANDDVLLKRWAGHHRLQLAKTDEERLKQARYLDMEMSDALFNAEMDREYAAEDAELRKTFQGRMYMRMCTLLAATLFFITETLGEPLSRLAGWWRKRRMIARCRKQGYISRKKHRRPNDNARRNRSPTKPAG